MKVLFLSVDPWKRNNSFGNTYSSIFGRIEDLEIAHVYLLGDFPDREDNITSYYQISESQVMRSLFKFPRNKNRVGQVVSANGSDNQYSEPRSHEFTSIYNKLLYFGKKHHWRLLFKAREIAWKFGNINYDGLFDFIDEFKPDLFLLAYYNVFYSNRIALRIRKQYDMPMVMVMMMDHYSLKRISYNPFFWIDRFKKRAMIQELVKYSEMMFVISKKLKEEMERELHIPCRILYKTPDENRAYEPYKDTDGDIKYLFTGNIYANRWKTLAMLAKELRRQGGGKIDIYTATPISKEMNRCLNIKGVSEIHSPVSQEEVIALQNNADVLVHAEAFDKYNKSLVRCAISTKIMDYLSVGRCVLAIGPADISSMEYLTDNNLALAARTELELSEIVRQLNINHSIIKEYALRARDYATNQLNATLMSQSLYDDLQAVIDGYDH